MCHPDIVPLLALLERLPASDVREFRQFNEDQERRQRLRDERE